jgi:cell migration-inducing and hyaluronan-binding protein
MNVGGGGGALGFSFGGGGGPPAAIQIAPGGGRIRGTPPPSVPVVLSRNGNEFTANGETNVRAGTTYKVATERPSLNLTVSELDAGSWVMFELPGFTTAASGTEQRSLDALRQASATSYYKGNDSLWVKLVSTGDIPGRGPGPGPESGDSLEVSR